MKTGDSRTVMEKAWVALGLIPLLAPIVPVKVPGCCGVPLRTPADEIPMPGGSEPVLNEKDGAGEPLAVKVKL